MPWESFDWISLLVGFLAGAVILLIVRIQSVKSLAVKVDKIGLDLGVEGFAPPEDGGTNNTGISTGGGGFVGGSVGRDFAGRDMNKNTTNNNTSTANAIKQYFSVKGRHDGKSIPVNRSFSLQASIEDEAFRDKLNKLRDDHEDWFSEWVDICFSRREINAAIVSELESMTAKGWFPISLDLDNIPGGLHINFRAERRFEIVKLS